MVKVMGKCGECGKCGEFSSLFSIFRDNNLLFYTELKCLLAPLLKTYPCEEGAEGAEVAEGQLISVHCKLGTIWAVI
jgi:hypothetical protein